MLKASILLACLFSCGGGKGRRTVLIDTDAGADDAMAILLLLSKRSDVDVVGITCLSGNAPLGHVGPNVLKTLDAAGRPDIPVFNGSGAGGLVHQQKSDHFFGVDGFGDFKYPHHIQIEKISKIHAVDHLIKTVQNNPKKITVLAIGPLTNIALALHLYPEFINNLKELVILGGNIAGKGNVRPGVEFNMYFDPEAASFVLSHANSNVVTILPLETVVKTGMPMSWRTHVLGKLKSNAITLLNNAEKLALKRDMWEGYDGLAAAYVNDPKIAVTTIEVKAMVETAGIYLRGALVLDYRSNATNVKIITQADQSLFVKMLLENLEE